MKFQILDSAGNHERFVMHIGREETKILIALLTSARQYTPKVPKTFQLLGSIRQMEQEFRKTLKQTEIKNPQSIVIDTMGK